MKQGFKRTVLLALCVVTALSAVPVNAADAGAQAPVLAGSRQGALTAVEDCRPDPDYMAWSDTGDPIELPRSRDYLSKPFVAKANGVKKKVSIYLMPQPESGHGNLGTVAHGEKVLVLAKRNGFYFFMTKDGRYGWNGGTYLKRTDDSVSGFRGRRSTSGSSGTLRASDSNSGAIFRDAQVGSVVTYGKYEQNGNTDDGGERIEWIVLEKKKDRVLLISRYILDRVSYDFVSGETGAAEDYCAWDNSTARWWLNSSFLHTAFTEKQQKRIQTVTVKNSVQNSEDKIFLLSSGEAEKYFSSNLDRMSLPVAGVSDNGDAADAFTRSEQEAGRDAWLLRPSGDYNKCAAYVSARGEICKARGSGLGRYINGIRPAMWVYTGGTADLPSDNNESSIAWESVSVAPYKPRSSYRDVSDAGDSLELPRSKDYLKTPYTATVNAIKRKVSIYLMPRPESGHGNLGTVAHGKKVLILAKRNGYLFFKTPDGRYGWNSAKYFKRTDDSPAVLEEFTYTWDGDIPCESVGT